MGGHCNKQDHDCPELTCGHPLPCPYHTVEIDTTAEPVTKIVIPATEMKNINQKTLKRLKQVGRILKDDL